MRQTGLALIAFGFAVGWVGESAASSCSVWRDNCIKGTAARSQKGVAGSVCYAAYSECMKTGVWDTTMYSYGVKKTGLQKK